MTTDFVFISRKWEVESKEVSSTFFSDHQMLKVGMRTCKELARRKEIWKLNLMLLEERDTRNMHKSI